MDSEFLALFTALFFIQNGVFALVGMRVLVRGYLKSRRRERDEQNALASSEHVAALHDQVAATQEMVADLLLQMNAERGVTAQPRTSQDGEGPAEAGNESEGQR